jgi:hypothetical protein
VLRIDFGAEAVVAWRLSLGQSGKNRRSGRSNGLAQLSADIVNGVGEGAGCFASYGSELADGLRYVAGVRMGASRLFAILRPLVMGWGSHVSFAFRQKRLEVFSSDHSTAPRSNWGHFWCSQPKTDRFDGDPSNLRDFFDQQQVTTVRHEQNHMPTGSAFPVTKFVFGRLTAAATSR